MADVGGETDDSSDSDFDIGDSGSDFSDNEHDTDSNVDSDDDFEAVRLWTNVYLPEPRDVRQDLPDFTVRQTGPRNAPHPDAHPVEYFMLFFSDNVLVNIVRETNQYARNLLVEKAEWIQNHPYSRFKRWQNLTVDKLKQWLGLPMNMGLIRKKDMKQYWQKQNRSQDTPYFRQIMSYNECILIKRMLHLANNTNRNRPRPGADAAGDGGDNAPDPWYKIRPVLDACKTSWKQFYVPKRELSIDESLVAMKNHTAYIQYLPNKRHKRFGIKKFELCEGSTGYVLHVLHYAGKQLEVQHGPNGQAYDVVMKLMNEARLLGKGYHLLTDNFYTKPPLARDLYKQNTCLTGTVRRNSKGIPDAVKNARLQVGETIYRRNAALLVVAFRDKASVTKPVLALSTFCNAENKEIRTAAGRQVTKPLITDFYNTGMGGVDVSDKKIYHLASERATHRYWLKLFMNLIDKSDLID